MCPKLTAPRITTCLMNEYIGKIQVISILVVNLVLGGKILEIEFLGGGVHTQKLFKGYCQFSAMEWGGGWGVTPDNVQPLYRTRNLTLLLACKVFPGGQSNVVQWVGCMQLTWI